MRVIFAGTPEFARVALAQLHAAGFTIPLVLTQPDRPAGRGMTLQPSAVKQFALEQSLPVAQPRSLRLDGKFPADAQEAHDAIAAAQADVMVVAAYGLILPLWTLTAPRLGCLNIHASLLPRWRGAAPIHRAIEAGDLETGVTIMQMDEGLDTGGMLLTERLPIRHAGPDADTTATLHDRLATLGGRMVVEALELAVCGGLQATPQPAEGITYAHKIEKAESLIDWRLSATALDQRVRAFDPFPGASSLLQGEAIKVWACRPAAEVGTVAVPPGTILQADADGLAVQCGSGVLWPTLLQRAGGKRLPVADFLRGFPGLQPGMVLGN